MTKQLLSNGYQAVEADQSVALGSRQSLSLLFLSNLYKTGQTIGGPFRTER